MSRGRKVSRGRKAPKVIRYGSPTAMLAAAEAVDNHYREATDGWYGSRNWDATVEAFRGRGCPRIGTKVGELVRTLGASMPAPPRPQWVRRPAGVLPSVPAYLAGAPAAMLDMRKVAQGPVKVVASVGASVSWTPEDMTRRGAAIAALVARLARTRPVELWVSSELGAPNTLELVRIPTAPMDVNAVGYALADPGVFRRLFLGLKVQRAPQYGGQWMDVPGERTGSPGWSRKVRECLQLTAADVYIPPAFGSPHLHLASTDPVQWVMDRAREVSR